MTHTPAPALSAVLDELDELRAKAVSTPWRAEEGRIYGGGYLLARVVGDEPKHHAARDADAALIVAAANRLPQLTAALRAVLDEHDGCECLRTTGEPCPTVAAITTALDAS